MTRAIVTLDQTTFKCTTALGKDLYCFLVDSIEA